jgi:hypothetical protein
VDAVFRIDGPFIWNFGDVEGIFGNVVVGRGLVERVIRPRDAEKEKERKVRDEKDGEE